jgi:uracil-DNA glycosylase
MGLPKLLTEIRACQVCAPHLPHEPRPVLRVGKSARLLLIGQAPGRRVHESGIPWSDPSGERLRDWLQLEPERFYDERIIAIMPMGLCYPGTVAGADLPPRPECAPLWHQRVLRELKHVELTLLVGSYAHAYYLAERRGKTTAETIRAYADYLPNCIPLPHPSWRNTGWLKRNPWFECELLPELRARVRKVIDA